jgi:phosphatidylglycerophosphate synthase/uncharacterized membrane protein YbhN (UPF0104 family)
MTGPARNALLPVIAVLIGMALLALTLAHTDVGSLGALSWQLGAALPVVMLPSAAWHLLRTAAWRCCFPAGEPLPFRRLFRVRLAAEAFSFVTIRGVAGEPLKVALLRHDVSPATSAAAVALERIAYLVVTVLIIGIAAAAAIATLPLSREWMRIFRVLAIVSACLIAGLAALLVRGAPGHEPRASSPEPEPGSVPEPVRGTVTRAVAAFVRRVQVQWRELVYRDRRRLVTLLALESASFAMMALEVWVVFRAMHVPVTAGGAIAIETLTRVASTLSAFIPAGIGALEASNVAAAAAVHASAGAAGLAIVRRLRGLLWCAAGFAIVPRDRTPVLARPGAVAAAPGRSSTDADPGPPPQAAFDADPGPPTLVVFDADESVAPAVTLDDRWGGLPIGERVIRAAVHAGHRHVLVWSPRRWRAWQALAARHGGSLLVRTVSDPVEWRRRWLAIDPAAIVTEHVPVSRDALARAERALRASIIKPTDGRLARFNRRLSTPISVWLIRRLRLGANAMSLFVLALGLYAGWLFSRGDYASAVIAAAISLVASILDGCDGELARLQYAQSAFGCWLDTLGDYVYYVATFGGLTVGVVRYTGRTEFWWLGAALAVGMLLTFGLLILLRHRATGGRPERLHAIAKTHFYAAGTWWAWLVATLAPCATRATMPYGILAFALLDMLPLLLILAVVGAHVYWISLAVELRGLLSDAREVGSDDRRGQVLDAPRAY